MNTTPPGPDRDQERQLERLADAPQPSFLVELLDFLRHEKKWWLIPILVMMLLLGVLVVLVESPAVPFIYRLF